MELYAARVEWKILYVTMNIFENTLFQMIAHASICI